MITQYSITSSAWTAITEAGESGTCWLDEDGDGGGEPDVRVIHSTGTPDASQVTTGKRLYIPKNNTDIMIISADSVADVFYARCFKTGTTAKVSVDI
jgi:hypothetical protein